MDYGRVSYLTDHNKKVAGDRKQPANDKEQLLRDLVRVIDSNPLDPSSPVPLYAQLASRLSTYISELGPEAAGKRFLSESECIELFDVSRPTVRQAISKLHSQGLVRKERGRGTFIADPRVVHDITHIFEDDMRAARRKVEFQLIEHGFVPATPALQEIFGSDAKRLYRMLRLRSIAGRVLGVEERYFPERFEPFLSAKVFTEHNVFSILKLCIQEQQITGVNAIRATTLDEPETSLTNAPKGSAALTRETTYFVQDNVPVMYGIVTFLADRYQLRFTSKIQL